MSKFLGFLVQWNVLPIFGAGSRTLWLKQSLQFPCPYAKREKLKNPWLTIERGMAFKVHFFLVSLTAILLTLRKKSHTVSTREFVTMKKISQQKRTLCSICHCEIDTEKQHEMWLYRAFPTNLKRIFSFRIILSKLKLWVSWHLLYWFGISVKNCWPSCHNTLKPCNMWKSWI